jgi:hypothetical protein
MLQVVKWAVYGALFLILLAPGTVSAQTPGLATAPVADSGGDQMRHWYSDVPPMIGAGLTDNCCPSNPGHPPPLTLCNFFTAGWNEEYTRHAMTEDVAPDFALLRVQTNFLERELRVNYLHEYNINNPKQTAIDSLDTLVAYALNRRFMIEVLGNEEWIDGRGKSPDESGPAARFVGRIQLIDTAESSYSFNFQAIAPDPGLGSHLTTMSYGLAGWEDLTRRVGWSRVGLYYSVLFDSLAGPHAAGSTLNDVQYDITIAKTLTPPEMPLIGNFTAFVEFFSQTNLDGTHASSTVTTITPAVRFDLGRMSGMTGPLGNWILLGMDIPVTGPKPYDTDLRLTYILTF